MSKNVYCVSVIYLLNIVFCGQGLTCETVTFGKKIHLMFVKHLTPSNLLLCVLSSLSSINGGGFLPLYHLPLCQISCLVVFHTFLLTDILHDTFGWYFIWKKAPVHRPLRCSLNKYLLNRLVNTEEKKRLSGLCKFNNELLSHRQNEDTSIHTWSHLILEYAIGVVLGGIKLSFGLVHRPLAWDW